MDVKVTYDEATTAKLNEWLALQTQYDMMIVAAVRESGGPNAGDPPEKIIREHHFNPGRQKSMEVINTLWNLSIPEKLEIINSTANISITGGPQCE